MGRRCYASGEISAAFFLRARPTACIAAERAAMQVGKYLLSSRARPTACSATERAGTSACQGRQRRAHTAVHSFVRSVQV